MACLGCAHNLLSPQPGGHLHLLGYSKVQELPRHRGMVPRTTAGPPVELAPCGPRKQTPRESPINPKSSRSRGREKMTFPGCRSFTKTAKCWFKSSEIKPPKIPNYQEPQEVTTGRTETLHSLRERGSETSATVPPGPPGSIRPRSQHSPRSRTHSENLGDPRAGGVDAAAWCRDSGRAPAAPRTRPCPRPERCFSPAMSSPRFKSPAAVTWSWLLGFALPLPSAVAAPQQR